jgi:hypothetical protein
MRASLVDVFADFDRPDITLAARIVGPDPIAAACALAFPHPPAAGQRTDAERLVAAPGLAAFCRALLNSNELIHRD